MKEYFVTFFNKVYLPQGLSLCESLNKVYSEFTLFIFCIDEETYKILKNLKDRENQSSMIYSSHNVLIP